MKTVWYAVQWRDSKGVWHWEGGGDRPYLSANWCGARDTIGWHRKHGREARPVKFRAEVKP